MNSHLISKINTAHVAKEVNIVMDSASSWNLTGDSYIDTLTDEDSTCSNIISNGFNLYYDETATANAWLEGKKMELNGGGQLLPQ